MARRRRSKKRYYTDPLTGQRKEVGAQYNPFTGRKIPKGHYEHTLTGELRKKSKRNNSDLFDISMPSLDTGGNKYRPRRKQRPLTKREAHFSGLALILFILVLGVFFIWQWISTHVWQSALIGVTGGGLFAFALYKSQRFRTFMMGDFWKKIGALLTPPKETSASVPGSRTPPLTQSEKNRVLDRAGNICEYCREERYHLDVHHIIPRSKGGTNKHNNLIVLCPKCHRHADSGSIGIGRLQGIVRNR